MKILVILIILFVFPQMYTQAQEESPSLDVFECPENSSEKVCNAFKDGTCISALSNESCEEKIKSLESSFYEKIIGKLKSHLDEILATFSALLLLFLAFIRNKMGVLTARLGDPIVKDEKRICFDTKAVNVLLVGEGGSGKTSIVRALSGCYHAKPSISTLYPSTYSIVHEVNVKDDNQNGFKRTLERVYLNDYMGQEAAQLTESNELRLREASIPSSVLIIIVDLFKVSSVYQDGIRPPCSSPDSARVQEQTNQYSETLLDILLNIPNELKSVILFINKIDCIRPLTINGERNAMNAYSDLIARLQRRARHFEFDVIVGAASKGWGISGFDKENPESPTLYELLKKQMVEIEGV